MRTLVVTIPGMIEEQDLTPLREVSEVEYQEMEKIDEIDLQASCVDYDYLMLNWDVIGTLTPDFYKSEAVRSLRAISIDMTGLDWASPASARSEGVKLLHIPHYSTQSVAESFLSEILLHSRQRHLAYVDQLHGRPVEGRKGLNLTGRTAGIIGLGSIGSRVAQLLESLGMTVLSWNRTAREGSMTATPEEIFSTSDVICICMKTVKDGPQANANFVGSDLLSLCKDAIIVNLANEALVDNKAMADALSQGKVRGYSVERSEAVLESPLGSIDEVHMPPANAWNSDESLLSLRETWVGNVVSDISGRTQNLYISE